MKKCISISFLLFSLLFVSCSIAYEKPYGQWQSEDPNIFLDIDPAKNPNKGYCTGIYTIDGQVYDVFIIFQNEKAFHILDQSFVTGSGMYTEKSYFNGFFEEKDGELYYTLRERYQEKTGYDTIVFKKIKDYDVSMD